MSIHEIKRSYFYRSGFRECMENAFDEQFSFPSQHFKCLELSGYKEVKYLKTSKERKESSTWVWTAVKIAALTSAGIVAAPILTPVIVTSGSIVLATTGVVATTATILAAEEISNLLSEPNNKKEYDTEFLEKFEQCSDEEIKDILRDPTWGEKLKTMMEETFSRDNIDEFKKIKLGTKFKKCLEEVSKESEKKSIWQNISEDYKNEIIGEMSVIGGWVVKSAFDKGWELYTMSEQKGMQVLEQLENDPEEEIVKILKNTRFGEKYAKSVEMALSNKDINEFRRILLGVKFDRCMELSK